MTMPGPKSLPKSGHTGQSSGVQGLDLVDVVAHHHTAAQLEARGQLATLLGPLVGEDRELPDRLRLRHRLVGLVDRGLDLGVQVRIVDEPVEVRGLAVVLRPRGHRLAIEGEQYPDERTAVAHHDALVDEEMAAEPVLEDGGGDVLSTCRDDDLLLPSRDPYESLVVDLADVTGVEPAVLVLRLGRRVVVVPVAVEDLTAPEEQLTVVGDSYGGALQRATDGPDL